MLTLRYARRLQTRPFFTTTTTTTTPYPFLPATSSANPQNDVVFYFREWFMSRKKPIFDRVFEILRTQDESTADISLSRFNLHLSETLVLDALKYEQRDVLSCLKFFDWAGRQPGFHHTRATFNAIFRILSKAKLMTLMLDFLQNYMKQRYVHKIRFYNVLVIGYAVAGESETALALFGRMRFMGVDLDSFAYHVLMNSLVEQGYYDVVETVAREIRMRGFESGVTHAIVMKGLCRQKELERGEEYLRGLVGREGGGGVAELSGVSLGTFVDALCKDNQFERAALLVDEFRRMGLVRMEHAYGVWIRDLLKVGKLDGALEFLKDKEAIEGYVPDVFRYNMLICRLLRESRLDDVYDLLVEMKEREILPDDVTMNAILCFLCKAGRMDVAMELYDSRSEFGLSVNCMAYTYLINTLLSDVSVDEAYRVLRNSLEQGYFPGQKTFSIIADALCREGRLDKMMELVLFALDRNIMPNNLTYDKFISALCRANRVEEGYLIHGLLNRLNKDSRKSTYRNLISGFTKSRRGDIAARLLIEMQDKGYRPSRKLIREVICCLCKLDNPADQFFRLLEMLLARHKSTNFIYNACIDGAGRARKPELAVQVYEMMRRSGLEPEFRSDIFLLQSYVRSEKIAHALHLFRDLSMKRCNRRLWHTMIVGLCKAKKPEYALKILDDMKSLKLRPSIECYEELVKVHCDRGQYYKAVDLVNDMTQIGRPITSFIGNIFLLHALRSRKVYNAWAYASHKQNLTPVSWMLGHLIGVFSGCIEGDHDDEDLEKLIQQCFRMDIYTVNMLLRRSSMSGMDYACKLFDRLRAKGYEPNKWTYDIILHGLAKRGRDAEARMWMEEMLNKGFDLTEATRTII